MRFKQKTCAIDENSLEALGLLLGATLVRHTEEGDDIPKGISYREMPGGFAIYLHAEGRDGASGLFRVRYRNNVFPHLIVRYRAMGKMRIGSKASLETGVAGGVTKMVKRVLEKLPFRVITDEWYWDSGGKIEASSD